MTNRRSILSTLCTGALALLAPVVAWAGMPKKKDASHLPFPDGWTNLHADDERRGWVAEYPDGRILFADCNVLGSMGWHWQWQGVNEAERYRHLHELDCHAVLKARTETQSLRALLAEARDTLSIIRAEVIDTYTESDEWPVRLQPPEWWNHYRRMADATLDRMKGHEHA